MRPGARGARSEWRVYAHPTKACKGYYNMNVYVSGNLRAMVANASYRFPRLDGCNSRKAAPTRGPPSFCYTLS